MPAADFDSTLEHTAIVWQRAYEAYGQQFAKRRRLFESRNQDTTSQSGHSIAAGPALTAGRDQAPGFGLSAEHTIAEWRTAYEAQASCCRQELRQLELDEEEAYLREHGSATPEACEV